MVKQIISYNPRLKELARKLRKNSTLAEALLWSQLKNKKILGFDFHRQKPIDNFIVDFFCPDLNLIIEIDGDTHIDNGEKDIKRREVLESKGFYFLRFDDRDVKNQLDDVISAIRNWIVQRSNTPRRLWRHPSREGNY